MTHPAGNWSHGEALDEIVRLQDALERAERERDTALARLNAMTALLRAIEWDGYGACINCGVSREFGHWDGCKLAALLAGKEPQS